MKRIIAFSTTPEYINGTNDTTRPMKSKNRILDCREVGPFTMPLV
jgi:hypothetical protein